MTFCPQNQKKRYSEVAELVFLDFATDLVLVFFFLASAESGTFFLGRAAPPLTHFSKKRGPTKKRGASGANQKKEVYLFFWSGRKPKEKRYSETLFLWFLGALIAIAMRPHEAS